MFMPPHADNANPDGTPNKMAHRDLSGIIYLNDDYEGGELYFTALDIAVKPRRGMLIGITAGFHHEHAVLRVEKGTRLTMPFFLTFDAEKSDRKLLQPDGN
jgi:leucine proline-enriched proteoglycan (leprecan)